MNARPRPHPNRAILFAITVGVIMLGAAALTSVGSGVAPPSPSGGATSSPTPTIPPTGSSASSSGQPLSAPTTTSIVHQGETSTLTMTTPSSGTPPYSWQWLYSTNGGSSYSNATAEQCAAPSGTGAAEGFTVTCSFATTDSTPTGTYLFELEVSDSASTPETVTSAASSVVTVEPALTIATASAPSSGVAVSASPSATYASVTPPASDSGSGASGLEGSIAPRSSDRVGSPGPSASNDPPFTLSSAGGTLPTTGLTASGTGWVILGTVTFTVSSGTVTQTTTCSTDALGSFTVCPFMIDAAPAGPQTVTATDSALPTPNMGTQPFTVDPSVGLSESSGVVGDLVTATGTGFAAVSTVAFSFDGNSVATTCSADSTGSFPGTSGTPCTFLIPAATAGDSGGSNFVATDASSNSASATFTVNPALTFSPSNGDVGGNVVLSGSGFTAGDVVTPHFGGTSFSCNEGTVSVAADGAFTCTVTVPSVATGPYSIAATTLDDGLVTAAGTFTVYVDPTVSVAPTGPLSYDVGQTANALTATVTYVGSSTVSVEWYSSASSSCNASSTDTGTAGASFTPDISTPGTTYYCAVVSDSGVPGYTSPSNAVEVTVNPSLGIPGAPTVTTPIDQGQSETVTASISGVTGTGSGTITYDLQSSATVSGTYTDTGASCTPSGSAVTCTYAPTAGTYYYEVTATDQATTPVTTTSAPSSAVTVNTALVVPTPTPGSQTVDRGQTATVTGTAPTTGASPYSYQWLEEAPSASSYSDATDCVAPTTLTCSFVTTGSTTAGTYGFELEVTDSAATPSVADSSPLTVVVNTALGTASAPTVSTALIDQGQTPTAATDTLPNPLGGTGPLTYTWLVSYNSGTYAAATSIQCATPSGPATNGEVVNCIVGASVAVGTYSYEIQLADSATTPTSTTSLASGTVTVSTALATASAPTVSTGLIDRGQTPTAATDTLPGPLDGSGTVTYTWLVSFDSGSFVPATSTQCMTPSGTASDSEVVNCVVGVSVAVGTYTYEIELTDTASSPETTASGASGIVAVDTALAAATSPSVSTTAIDQGQTPTAATDTLPNPLGGSGAVTYTWLVSFNSGTYRMATSTQCVTPTGTASNGEVVNCVVGASVAVGTYTYEIVLTDTASNPSTTTSLASGTVTVNSALASTNAPTVSTGLIDRGQTPTAATDTLPSPLGGSGTVTYTWVVSFDSGSYTAATSTQCQTPTGTASNGEVVNCVVGATVAVGTYTYQIELIDSASNPETTASGSSGIVVVNTALAAATSPTVSTASIDQGQTPIAATDTLPNPLGGSGAVTYSWLVSFNSGAYAAATSTQCATPSGTASNGKVVNCVVGASVALGSYTYEIQLRDSASSPSTTISLASGTVTVNPPLGTPGAPSVTTPIDQGQSETVTASISGVTGTGSGTITYHLLSSATVSGTYTDTGASCTPSGSAVACTYAPTAGTYYYEVTATDQATTPVTTTSSASTVVTVNAALAITSTPTVSTAVIDRGQTPTAATDTLPNPLDGSSPVTYTWTVSFDLGPYAAATSTQCQTPTGTASNAEIVNCVVGAGAAVGTYTYKIQLSDSATTPTTTTSLGSGTVTVNTVLVVPTPTPGSQTVDRGQTATVTGTAPTTGTSPYSYQWLEKAPGATSYSDAIDCAAPTTLTCSFVTTGSTTTGTYGFELEVTDSATTHSVVDSSPLTVVVTTALVVPTPTPGSQTVDRGQTATVTGTAPTTGTSPYSYQWLEEAPGATSYSDATDCAAPTTLTCSFVTTGSTTTGSYSFELQVTDSATTQVVVDSSPESVVVNQALTAPATPTPSTTALDADQPMTVTAAIPSSGTPLYSWQWLVEVNGVGSYADATTQCGASASGSAAHAADIETCNIPGNTLVASTTYSFELQVTDSASTPETQTSAASSTVTTSASLT